MIPVNDLKRGYLLYKNEYDAKVIDVLESGWYVLGKEVAEFETEFASRLNAKHCIGVDNGLNAISIGIKMLNIGEGDEIIVQSNTYIATCLGVSSNNAKIVFVEPDEYFNIDAAKIEEKITERTKAILVTHLYGQASNMKDIKNICIKHNLYLLEDCAQAHLAQFDGEYVGTFGDLGFFSFYPTKNLGGFGDGGAIVTNNLEYDRKLRILRNYGSDYKYHNCVKGFNSRLDEIHAGLLRIKLGHLDELTEERQRIAEEYHKNIHNPLVIKPKVRAGSNHVYHLYVIKVENRNGFKEYLFKNGIMSDVHYPIPPHLSKAYEEMNMGEGSLPIAEKFADTVVSLPIFNGMEKNEICKVINIVNEYRG